ncbi:hypothetical protein [Desulfoscipio geothermicus]|uniref:Type II secretion system protein GspF domain-containing protein n=1 Tax=Desulfoscipio geothermicus DSM 3669 TaxID=1121426 RepID=A0A1I6E4D2_9FIRM|nr:hypothetical protein [Desulfoscipio geothermicus]SFR12605.1 hypothetical protein SAMN05660706_12563 [Desulfoscipio geothermicus DSM 3669]
MIWQEIIPVILTTGGIGLAFAGAALLAIRGAEALYEKITGRISLKRLYRQQQQQSLEPVLRLKKLNENLQNNRDLIKMSALVFGAGIIGALIMPGTTLKIYGFSSGAGAGAFFYSFYQKQRKKGVRLKKLKEAIFIYDAINVYSETGENLPNILEKILPALDTLRPAVEKFLKQYPYKAKEAVLEMEKEMDFNEAGMLASVFLQTLSSGGHNHITASEGVRMENTRKTIYKTDIAVRPLYRQLVLFLPAGAGVIMVLYTLGRHVLNSLSMFNASQILK